VAIYKYDASRLLSDRQANRQANYLKGSVIPNVEIPAVQARLHVIQ
jgi:hypothetical protein